MREIRYIFKTIGCYHHTYKQIKFYSTNSDIRVRFAPSPTGLLHLGGLRTALYNYLFAKSQGGTFILRIEDTDQNRLVPGAVEQLQNDLVWAGVVPDEGPNTGPYGPYKQSKRLHIYKKEVERLVDEEKAYHCFCSENRLNLLRKDALRLREIPKYDNKCRHLSREEVHDKLSKSEESCIRFKLSLGDLTYNDLVYGTITHDIAALEGDPVIMKTDGFPTYHLANVVDDHYMVISHVLRGVEWQPSTAKHLQIYKAFGWKPPLFAHLPLLVNSDGTKFSKRQGDMTLKSFRENGIYPRSLINFVAFTGGFSRLEGGAHEPRTFSVNELTKMFDLSLVHKNPCRLMFEQLPEFNRAEMTRRISNDDSLKVLVDELKQLVIETVSAQKSEKAVSDLHLDDNHVIAILKWCGPRVTQLKELISPDLMFLWMQPSVDQLINSNVLPHKGLLNNLIKTLNDACDFNQESLKDLLKQFATRNDIKFNQLMKILRLSLTGLKEGPGVAEIMEILGKDCTCKRLNRVCELQSHSVEMEVKL